jgi:hypothetical protein
VNAARGTTSFSVTALAVLLVLVILAGVLVVPLTVAFG